MRLVRALLQLVLLRESRLDDNGQRGCLPCSQQVIIVNNKQNVQFARELAREQTGVANVVGRND